MNVPAADTLLEHANALVPTLRARLPEAQALRRVPDATIADFVDAGFFRMLQPRAFGGLEVHPNTFFDVQVAIATGCASSAWVMSVLAVHAWQLALFPEQAQRDVWGESLDARIASSYAPTGQVSVVDGGYRLSGRWAFSSGSDHSDWIFLGGMVPTDKGPQMRTFLLPRADFTIVNNWDVAGLAASGSNDIVVDDAFVPEHRTHRLVDGFTGRNPGADLNDAPLFKLPFGQVFVRSVSSSIIGCLEGALEAYLDIARSRISASTGKQVKLDPDSQMVCAEALATLESVKAVLHRSFDSMMDHVNAGRPVPLDDRVLYRFESARAVRLCLRAVDDLFTQSGGRSLFLDSPMQQHFQDAHAIAQHFANKPGGPGRNLGGVLLGADNADLFV